MKHPALVFGEPRAEHIILLTSLSDPCVCVCVCVYSYDLMLLCWRHSLRQRPNFSDIIEMLVPDLNQTFVEDSYYFTPEYQDALAAAAAAIVAAANAAEQDEGDEGVDACTPLTGRSPKDRPHRARHRSEESEPPDGGEGETFPLQTVDDQASSFQSSLSLSYQSHKSDASPACNHRTPSCHCVDIDSKDSVPNHGWHGGRAHGVAVGGPNGGGGSGDKWNPQPSSKWSVNTNSSPNSAIESSEGSKESSKSSDSTHSHMNGGVVNGHVPRGYISPPHC